jgi:hypothetical protein
MVNAGFQNRGGMVSKSWMQRSISAIADIPSIENLRRIEPVGLFEKFSAV